MKYASKVAWAVMENHGYDQVKDLSSHQRLAKTGAIFTNYFAVVHPSGPNYRTLACGDSVVPTEILDAYAPSVASNIGSGFAINKTTNVNHLVGTIAARHNPYVDAHCNTHLKQIYCEGDLTIMDTNANHLYLGWDDENNAHSASLDIADKNLNNLLDVLDTATWFNTSSDGLYPLFMFVWDESLQGNDHNQVFCAFYGKGVKPGIYDKRYDHYSFNRTMTEIYQIPALGFGAKESPMLDCL
jgi:hypothetical protein